MTEVTCTHRVEIPRDDLALLVQSRPELIPLRGRTVTIGRNLTNDLVLADRTVSALHCQVADDAGCYRIRDLGSRNGTRLNGVPIQEGMLHCGARLEIGRSTLICIRQPTTRTIGAGPDRLVGSSVPMMEIKTDLARFAVRDSPVLLQGESGTGKELAARGIHHCSARSRGPFVSVNCGALPTELAMSELFGHVRGAFTGANSTHRGAFEQANEGTLFLDEIGELDQRLQAALLRVLETGVIRRVGSEQELELRVRIIAATNRDLLAAIRSGDFRRDLYHRLAVLLVRLPPLRQHPADIPEIVRALLDRAGFRHELSPAALARLARHCWPGNVRELRNVLERACALAQGDVITEDDLRFDADQGLELTDEERFLLCLLDDHNGNVAALARTLRMRRTTLRDWINRIKEK